MERTVDRVSDQLVIERIFNAPLEMVWRAWSDPKYVSRWWGPKGFTAPFCEIDFRVGGRFLFCMKAPDGAEYWNAGEYREIISQTRIASVMYFSDRLGNRVKPSHHGLSDDFPEEMLDVVTFEVVDKSKTKLTLQRNHSSALAKRFGEIEGWNQSLDKFAEALTRNGI